MDGSYGNVFPTGRAIAPSAPAASGNQYKVNVNRQKTRKWANFKPQNYDGDDWGAEDDDEPAHDPEPPLPPKPLGPRQPAAHSPTSRQFHPVGSPPLRTHTHQYTNPASARPGQSPIGSSPSSILGGPPRRATEPLGASPHNTPGHPHPQLPADAVRASPTAQSAHLLPSQLPSQMSGMPSNTAEDSLGPVRQPGSNPRPSDNSKPWMDARSASPQSAGPLSSPNKPLPFIRPADLYRRMEEEREKERRSLETGRPSMENSGVRSGEPGFSEVPPLGDAHVRATHSTVVMGDAGAGRGPKSASGLPPIDEKKSEYNVKGLLAGYGPEGSGAEPDSTTRGQEKPDASQKSVQPVSLDEIRRFSRSPQLPDLTRMSGFGEDLFSSSSFLPSSGLRSPVSDSMPLSAGESLGAAAEVPGQPATIVAPQSVTSSSARHGDLLSKEGTSQDFSRVDAEADAPPPLPNEPDQDRSAGLPLHQGSTQPAASVSELQTPTADAARQPASSNQPATQPTRPRLPCSWVTETPSTPAEVAVSQFVGSSEEAPGEAAESEGVTRAEAPPDVASLNKSSSQHSESEEATGATSLAGMTKDPIAVLHPHSPHGLPPLRTSSPALSSKSGMSSQQARTEVPGRNASPILGIQAAESSSPIPASAATEQSEIPPTAPLNPRRGSPDGEPNTQHVLSPSSVPTEPALDASAHAQDKDSDMLSEEIIKSLSPHTDSAQGSSAAYRPEAPGLARESSYLGDVYGDYWAASEDDAEPGLLTVGKTIDTEKAVQDPLSLPTEIPEGNSTMATHTASSTSPSSPTRAAPVVQPGNGFGGLQSRFSWEATPEGSAPAVAPTPAAAPTPANAPTTATEHMVEQKALGSGAGNVAPLTAELDASGAEPLQLSLGSEGEKSAEDLRAESAPEFDPAGARASGSASDRPIQSPSPAFDPTGRSGDGKRLSLAEEKIVFQESSYPVSPSSPLLEQHPALADNQQPRLAEPAEPRSPQNITSFRNIMEMPSPAERIRRYNETRWQFSAVDTGLDDWLKATMSRHPEHANVVLSYQGMAPHTQQSGQGAAQTAQGAGQGGRAPTHLHMPQLQHGLSGLGHSSNQVGTKSKELLMAAGKAGKGLFSKGRNKLRGTGDKVFSN